MERQKERVEWNDVETKLSPSNHYLLLWIFTVTSEDQDLGPLDGSAVKHLSLAQGVILETQD